MFFFQRQISLFLIICLGFSPFQTPSPIYSHNHIAPFSQFNSPPVKKLTPFQEETLRGVFVNTEMKETLDAIIRSLLEVFEREVGSSIDFLSSANVQTLSDNEDEDAVEIEEVSPVDAVSLDKKTYLIELLNRLISYHLLREVRMHHHTKQNKMKRDGGSMAQIDSSLEEMMAVLPTDGIEFFYIKGVYVLAYKEFILFLHSEENSLGTLFEDVLKSGKRVFHHNENVRENLTLYQLSNSEQRKALTVDWPVFEFPAEPTSEMKETLEKQRGFISWIAINVTRIRKSLIQIQEWLVPLLEASSEQQKAFHHQLEIWVKKLDALLVMVKSYSTIDQSKTISVVRKISLGLKILTDLKSLAYEISREFTNVKGHLYVQRFPELFPYFNFEKVLSSRKSQEWGNTTRLKSPEEEEEEAKNEITTYFTLLDEFSLQTISKLSRLRTLGQKEEVRFEDLLEEVSKDYLFNGVPIEIEPLNDGSVTKLVTNRFDLALILSRLFEEALSHIQKLEGDVSGRLGGKVRVRYSIEQNSLVLVITPYTRISQHLMSPQPEVIRDLNNSGRFKIKLSDVFDWNAIHDQIGADVEVLPDQSRRLTLPLTISSDERKALVVRPSFKVEGNASLSSASFKTALRRYRQKKVKRFFHSDLIKELHFFNTLSTVTLGALPALNVEKPFYEIVDLLGLTGTIEELNRLTLRDVSDQTGLRLSEIVHKLGIEVHKKDKEFRQITIFTHANGGVKDVLTELEKASAADSELVLLRLVTEDAAGNTVEQLIIDRFSRIKQFHYKLGSPASFQKFLFNARRTFDIYRREIVQDEIYLDPQAKGFGTYFYRNQLRSFIRSGFVTAKKGKKDKREISLAQAQLREDTISHVALQWMGGATIDWEHLAFKEHWLRSMKSLFQELGIPIPEGRLTTEKLKSKLKATKEWSRSFEKYLEIRFEKTEFFSIFRTSDEVGYVEFLNFRLLGYGRRQVFREKLKTALNALPEISLREREEGLSALDHPNSPFWEQIQNAQQHLISGMEKSDLMIEYLPDFSRGSKDRRRAHELIESLLARHEFGLSLTRRLRPEDGGLQIEVSKTKINFSEQKRRYVSVDDHVLLDKMQAYFFQTGETVAPNFIDTLERYDRKIDRYRFFWKDGWDRPERHYLRLAKVFHQKVTEMDLDYVTSLGSRLYYPELTDEFLKFVHIRLQSKKRSQEIPSYEEMAKVLRALFYWNPQLAGIIIRSSSGRLAEMKSILSELPNSMIARILDLEITPFPQTEEKVKRFNLVDKFVMLNLIEPNQVYDLEYLKRVKQVLKFVEPSTLANILQQSYESYRISSETVSEELGWFESVFLTALRGWDTSAQFTSAMRYLEEELKDEAVRSWVQRFFSNESSPEQETVTVRWFVDDYVEPRLVNPGRPLVSLLGKQYSPQIYGAFMRYFNGYAELEVAQQLYGVNQARSASEVFSDILSQDLEIAGLIVRSTPDTHDAFLYGVLIDLSVKELGQLFDQEVYFIPQKESSKFKTVNRYVMYRMFDNLFQKKSPKVKQLLDAFKPETIAALIQYMWLNRADGRFNKAYKSVLKTLTDLLDSKQIEEIKRLLEEQDHKDSSAIARWFSRKVLGEVYSEQFYEALASQYPWVSKNGAMELEAVESKMRRYFELNQEVLTVYAESSEKFAEVVFVFEHLLPLLKNSNTIDEAFFVYGRVKMEMNDRLLIQIMDDVDEKKLAAKKQALFLFTILEQQFDLFFLQYFKENGIYSLDPVTQGKAILRVKVIENRPENREQFQQLKKADLVITNSFPENDPLTKQPGAIVLGIPRSTNGHAYELAKAWKIPCAFLPFSHQTLKELDGEIVVFDVDNGHGVLRLANREEKEEFERRLPQLDISVDAFSRLEIPEVALGEDEPFVLKWNQMDPTKQREVGYKAVRLARVKQETELPVPDFFSITYNAFQAFLEHNKAVPKIRELLRGIDDLGHSEEVDRLTKIQAIINRGKFPKEMVSQIEQALDGLEDQLYVRSSSNVEDLPNFSGAGTLESYKSSKEKALENVKKVWVSLWSEAFQIRKAHGVKGEEHLRASVSVVIQNRIDPQYSGTVATGYKGDPNLIEISIDEGISRVVDDAYEGQTSPHILFNMKTGEVKRPFEDRPKFWNHSELGLGSLVEYLKVRWPKSSQDVDLIRDIIWSTVHEKIGLLQVKIESYVSVYLLEEGVTPGGLAESLKAKLAEINQEQAESLFKPLYEAATSIEKAFTLSPVLVEYAIENRKVIALQVKGHEGARRIAFDVMVLNKWKWHNRVINNFRAMLKDFNGKNLFEKNKILFGLKKEDEYQFVEFGEEAEEGNAMKELLKYIMLKGDIYNQGDIIRFQVMGPNAIQIGQLIRRFFLMLSVDYDYEPSKTEGTSNVLQGEGQHFISWEEAVRIFGFYIEEDDFLNPHPWRDIQPNGAGFRQLELNHDEGQRIAIESGSLWEIYQAVFGHHLQPTPEAIETAI